MSHQYRWLIFFIINIKGGVSLVFLTKAIEWINHNSAFISTLSTIGLVILTFFYVIYTQKILKANQEMILEARNTRRQENMPNIIAYFDVPKVNLLNFVIENIGKSVAVNTKVKLEPIIDFQESNYLHKSYMINNELATIAPNQKLITFVDTMFNMKNQEGNFPKFKASITFHDYEGSLYNAQYILDLNAYNGLSRIEDKGIHELTKEVTEVRKELAKMIKGLQTTKSKKPQG